MNIKLAFLIALLIVMFQPPNNTKREPFLGEYYTSFNPNNKNDYWYDRTGMKGTLFRKLLDKDKYELPKEHHVKKTTDEVRLLTNLYDKSFYTGQKNCPPVMTLPNLEYREPDYLHQRLQFNQGVLYNQPLSLYKSSV